MDIVEAYSSGARLFHLWVRAMEIHTRHAEVSDSAGMGGHVLIISPPTDPAIPLLGSKNATGKTTVVCFSEYLQRLTSRYVSEHGSITGIDTVVVPFFRLPFADSTVRAIYTNCFLDFCRIESLKSIIAELWRVLEPNGALYSVYMAAGTTRPNRLWAWAFERLPRLSGGCHPVSITESLSQAGFRVVNDQPMNRFGFPIRYTRAERLSRVA